MTSATTASDIREYPAGKVGIRIEIGGNGTKNPDRVVEDLLDAASTVLGIENLQYRPIDGQRDSHKFQENYEVMFKLGRGVTVTATFDFDLTYDASRTKMNTIMLGAIWPKVFEVAARHYGDSAMLASPSASRTQMSHTELSPHIDTTLGITPPTRFSELTPFNEGDQSGHRRREMATH